MKAWAILAAAAFCAAAPAFAQVTAGPSNKRWKQADACVADANRKVPDHTEEAQRQRDKLANDCMILHKYPPLTNTAPTDKAAPATPPSN